MNNDYGIEFENLKGIFTEDEWKIIFNATKEPLVDYNKNQQGFIDFSIFDLKDNLKKYSPISNTFSESLKKLQGNQMICNLKDIIFYYWKNDEKRREKIIKYLAKKDSIE